MPKYIDGVKKIRVKKTNKKISPKNFLAENKKVEKSASGIFYVAKKDKIEKPKEKISKDIELAEETEDFFKKDDLPKKENKFKNKFSKISELAEKRMTRQKEKIAMKKKQVVMKKEQKVEAEKERLEKIATEKQERTAKQLKIIQEGKKQKNQLKRRKGLVKKAKAKMRAEKLSLKLDKKEEFKKKIEETKKRKKKQIKLFFINIKKQSKKIFLSLVMGVIILIIILGGLSYPVYNRPITNDLNQVLIRKLPFPAIFIDYRPVRYSQYFDDMRLLGGYYLAEVKLNVSDEEFAEINKNDLVMDKIIEKRLLENLAGKYNIKVERDEIETVFNKLATELGEDEFIDKIYNSYGLTKKLFNEKIVYYIALEEKIKKFFIEDDTAHKGASLRMGKVEKLLKKNKDNFEDLAQKYSEDIHALKGGDIGYVRLEDMTEKLKQVIAGLNKDDVSEIVKEEDRYYIVKIYDVKEAREGQEIWLKKISIFTNYSFDQYLEDLKKEAKIWMLIQS